MERKAAIKMGLVIGSMIGSYIPLLWGADFLSFSSVIFSALGAVLGVFLGYKLGY